MGKKILCVLMLLTIVCALTSCEHVHTWDGERTVLREATCLEEGIEAEYCLECGFERTDNIPKIPDHSFSNGTCSGCNLSVVTAIGNIVMQNPDRYVSGAYIKSFTCSTFSSREGASNYGLGFAYNESSNTLLLQLTRNDLSTESITITINSGVIASRYEYLYSYTNPVGGYTDQIEGTFTATSLSSTSAFGYTNYSAGSGSAFSYFVNDYKKDAASCAKLLVQYLNDFLYYNDLGFTANEFNLR